MQDVSYSDKLRWLADYLDSHPAVASELSEWDSPRVHIYAEDWEQFQTIIRTLGGFEKDGYGGTLEAKHIAYYQGEKIWQNEIFRVVVSVSEVCERVPKVDDDGAPVVRPKRVMVDVPGEVEPEYTWKCPESWTS